MFWKEERRHLADWIDEKEHAIESRLERWVVTDLHTNPAIRAHQVSDRVFISGTVTVAMRLITGTTDVLRIGQGVEHGGVKGYALDGLRLLVIAGPLARGVRLLATAGNRLRIAMIAETQLSSPLGVCSWVAATQAMRMTGRIFVTIDELLQISGVPGLKFLSSSKGYQSLLKGFNVSTYLRQIIYAMKKLGATVTHIGNPATMQAVEAATKQNGVILFNISWSKGRHTLVAFRNALGQFRILDRTGNVVRSLAELEMKVPGYGNISTAVPFDEMYFVAEMAVREIIGLGISTIGIEVNAATSDHE